MPYILKKKMALEMVQFLNVACFFLKFLISKNKAAASEVDSLSN